MNTKMNFNQKVVDMRESITDYFNLLRDEKRLIDKTDRHNRHRRKSYHTGINYMNHPDYGGIQEAKQITIDKLSDIAD